MNNRYVIFSGVKQVDVRSETVADHPSAGTLLVRSE